MKLATILSVLVGSLMVAGQVRAETLHPYDLDSLVYLSTEVAEVEIARSYKAHDLDLMDVKVTLVHKGGFKKGQTVVVSDAGYGKPKNPGRDSQRLAVGDRLVIFVKGLPRSESSVPEDVVIYAPLNGGMRLVQGDEVISFSQLDSFGGYEPAPTKTKLTVASFREKVKSSLRDTDEWARLVDAKEDKLDVPRLLKLLGDRSKQTHRGRDYFTERICLRFANTHDIFLLSDALPLAKGNNDAWILQHGFGTPQGRDYLLAKVMDEKEPMPARLRYSYALHHADSVYRSTLTEIGANGHRHVGEADDGNSGYITRIAKAAHATGKHEELCGSLVRCIDYFGQGITQNKPAPMMADLLGSFAVLKELYETKPSQNLQFALEKATAWDRNAYEKLKSPCGAFISILRAVDPAKYTKPEKRSLIFEYEYTTLLLSRDVEVHPSVVLLHQETQNRHVIPSQLKIRGWQTGGGSNSVELPKDLPAGRYRVFFQVSDGDKVISTGHHFAADL
jgi:hypothetical protein